MKRWLANARWIKRVCAFTLIELLAALVILSSVAAAGAAVLREAGAAARRADLARGALAALRAWERESSLSGAPLRSLEFTEVSGRRWLVECALHAPESLPLEPLQPGSELVALLEVGWIDVRVTLVEVWAAVPGVPGAGVPGAGVPGGFPGGAAWTFVRPLDKDMVQRLTEEETP